MTVFSRLISTLSLGLVVLLLSSCGNTPVKPAAEAEPEALTLETLQAYVNEREGLSDAQIVARKINAADFLLRKKQVDRAHKLIDTINTRALTAANSLRYQLVNAKIALQEGEPYIAQRYLFSPISDDAQTQAPKEIAIAFYDLRAQLMYDQAEYFKSVDERLTLSRLLSDDEQSLQLNHDLIWEALSDIPTAMLFDRARTERDSTRQGWYSLAAISKSNGANFRQQIIDIEEWRNIWPDHAANALLPADLQLILQLANQQALKIAAFLPLSGRLEAVGGAIREGIMAGYYDDVSHHNVTPNIQFFDTSGQDINALYDQAANEGIELVIGPLDKEHVSTLSQRETLPVPILALNSYDRTPPTVVDESINIPTHDNIFYFSLAIESETKQVAERAWRDGHRRALIIAPSSNWGDRGVDAFMQAWQELGGELVDDQRFKDQRSYSKLIEGAVGVDKSKNRRRQLQRLLGTNLEFEPRRRKDIDFVFLLAYPSQARQFLPLLAFHYASDIPVYATSQSYSEDAQSGLSDLDGLRFSAMPWHFDKDLNERRAIQAYGDNQAPYQSLYALGVDAYHIYPRLEQLQLIRQAQFYGTTGKLRLSNDNVIERTQNWAEIRNGSAVELNSIGE